MSKKIFIHDDIFPQIKSDKEYEGYKNNHPNFDPEYILQHCYIHRKETRIWLESIWEKYEKFAEPDLIKHIREPGLFHSFSWQLYLASLIFEKNHKIQPNNGIGPDLQIEYKGKNLWIEAVVTTPGNDKNAAGIPNSGGIYESLNPRVARITNALTTKYDIYKRRYLGSICKEDEPFIIAVNGSETNSLNPSRAAEATVFARGNDQIKRMPDGSMKGGFYELREFIIIKKGEKEVKIPTNYFCNDKHKEISGIMYCEQHVINANNNKRTPEANIFLLLNPYAKNPVDYSKLKIGKLITMDKNRKIFKENFN